VNPYRTDVTMPGDFDISIGEKGGSERLLRNPSSARPQRMRGFEPQYTDIVDYIVRITHRIWEEKEIGYIYSTYRHNSKVTDDSGLQYGRDKIVADTVHTINAFPDVRLHADEVIWAGDDEAGFHTSHRTVIVGHNTGYSRWGTPTGRKVVVWAIANCEEGEHPRTGTETSRADTVVLRPEPKRRRRHAPGSAGGLVAPRTPHRRQHHTVRTTCLRPKASPERPQATRSKRPRPSRSVPERPFRPRARVDRERLGDQACVLLAWGVMEVLHRRLDVRMTHPLLDAADVGFGDHPRPERMT